MSSNIPLKYLEEISEGDLEIFQSRHFDQTSNIWVLDEHRHAFVELIYFVTGEAQIMTPQGETSLTLYDVLVHPRNVMHREFVDLHKRQEIFNLFVNSSADSDINESFVLKDNTGNIRRIFTMLHYHMNNKDYMQEEIVSQLTYLLMTYLRKSAAEQPILEYGVFDRIIEYVQENYMNDLTVKELADYVHVSESYLSRLMSSKIGVSPMKYVNHVRIESAKQVLKTDRSIDDIAVLTGFKESKYFSTVFKRQTGITPSEFRKEVSRY